MRRSTPHERCTSHIEAAATDERRTRQRQESFDPHESRFRNSNFDESPYSPSDAILAESFAFCKICSLVANLFAVKTLSARCQKRDGPAPSTV